MWSGLIGLTIVIGLHAAMVQTAAGGAFTPGAAIPAHRRSGSKPTKELRVAVVQMRSSRSLNENLDKTKKYLEQCARDGARVVVFPECSVTGYFDKDFMKGFTQEQLADAERQIAETCKERHIYAIVGMPCRESNKLYNSAVVIDPAGKVVERYHKLQLAEEWPDEGDHLSVFKIDGAPCSIIICHDERYPELVRLPVLAGARLIFYLSHESGIREERKIEPYRAQIQARAVENSVFVVQANAPGNQDASGSHGHSRIVAPDGNIVQEASIFQEDVLTATLDLNRASGGNATRSLTHGPLGDWWREGVKRVRVIDR
jgi:predicted amidohydrolase